MRSEKDMKRFKVTYTRDGVSVDIEGVQFSNGVVVLEYYPDDEWTGAREFRNVEDMNYHLNEFGDAVIEWMDKEKRVIGNFAIVGEPGPEIISLPAGSSVYPSISVSLPPYDTLWQIAQEVAEEDSIYSTYQDFDDVSCGFCCSFCSGNVPGRMNDLQFPHTSDCIVTKARELMEWRKAQPRIDVSIKKSDELAENKLREMVRQMVSEALAKPPEQQPEENAIVNIACEICEENYVGLLSNLRQGWYGIVEQGTWEKPEPRKEYAFCSEEHMKQWRAERGQQ
jgi:hypothetical protein